MPKAFIINEPLTRDPLTGRMDRKMDLSKAEDYGEIVHVLPAGTLMNDLDHMIEEMHRVLADYTEEDYLVLVGNPIAICVAGMIAGARTEGRINVLRWHNRHQCYEAVALDALAPLRAAMYQFQGEVDL